MPPSNSKPKAATQQSLLGFFSKTSHPTSNTATKPKVPPPSTANAKLTNGGGSSFSPIDHDEGSSLTPPPTVRKVTTSNPSRQQYSSNSHSPTETRGLARGTSKQAEISTQRRNTELTPPSSSPVMDMDEDEDGNEDQLSRFPRRRAAVKRRIKYVESDEEGMSQNGGQDDSDDDDRFSPEKEEHRSSKKSKNAKGRSTSVESDEFDDFIIPDDELLGGE